MVPINTSIEDMQKFVGYLSRQVGWVEAGKVEKTLGSTATDDRKISAMVAFGLVQRDGINFKASPRGHLFMSDQAKALGESVRDFELYRSTVEWLRYQGKSQATAVEIGQYWENSHADTLGDRSGSTLKAGAVCFGRVVEGAGLGSFVVGRGGKETRLEVDQVAVESFVDGAQVPTPTDETDAAVAAPKSIDATPAEVAPVSETLLPAQSANPTPAASPTVAVSASPNVHVNVEIHIAADATAGTVREIFRNMARYVLDKHVEDDDD